MMHLFRLKINNKTISLICLICALSLLFTGCHNMLGIPSSKFKPSGPRVNCIIISIDTLRADHLGCYGHKGTKTPNIDALASEGTMFSRAYTPVPVTLPSHSTMLTGLFPVGHGVRNNGTFRLDETNVTLAELFGKAGYRTGAFIGAFVLDSRFGLNQGFEVYDDRLKSDDNDKDAFFYNERPAEKVIESAVEWIGKKDDRPFFAFIHCFDPHAPYDPPSPFKEDYADNLYEGEISYVDIAMGKLFTALKDLNLFDSTIICFTADHGEGLGEHGEKTHAIFIYDATLHVPLIFRIPGKVPQGLVIDKEVNLTDIFPTLIDLAGIKYDGHKHGISLFTPGRLDDRVTQQYCETFYPLYNHRWSPLEGIRTPEWKYIRAPRPELYCLRDDPNELTDLYKKRPDIVKVLEQLLDEKIKEFESLQISQYAHMNLDTDTKGKLESLGYIWTAPVEAGDKEHASYPDPKDMIGLLDYLNRGTYYYTSGDFDEAIEEFKALLKVNPNDVFTHFVLGYIYDKKGWTDMAINELEEAIRLDPGYINAYNNLGTIYNKIGKTDEAIKNFRVAVDLNPSYLEAYDNIGVVYYMMKDYDQAMYYFNKAIELEPNYAAAYNNIGSIYVAQGRFSEAIDPIQKALKQNPDFIDAHNNLGSAYLGLGKLKEAEDLFRRTLYLDPNHEEARINLATMYIQAGQYDMARNEIGQVISTNPNIAKVYNCLGTILIKEGRLDEAVEQFKESIKLDPDSFETYYNLGIAYFSLGRLDDAIREYNKAIDLDDKNPGAYVNLGIALFHNGLIDNAIDNYILAKQLDANNVESMVNLGVAYYSKGLIEEAIQEYTMALAIKPDNLQALINLGIAYFGKGSVDKAIESYVAALKIDPGHIDARINLGVAYFNQQRYQEAMQQYNEVISLDPQNFQAYYGLGYCSFMVGFYEDAMRYLREAVRIKPDYTEAYILLDQVAALLK
ncbi:tetratricopeptide repeat protein [bacterium]|nr:tetratricopeptide repeat protein [bacterium]